jgi:hypothetical protein
LSDPELILTEYNDWNSDAVSASNHFDGRRLSVGCGGQGVGIQDQFHIS